MAPGRFESAGTVAVQPDEIPRVVQPAIALAVADRVRLAPGARYAERDHYRVPEPGAARHVAER
jgi:hypothetical protein